MNVTLSQMIYTVDDVTFGVFFCCFFLLYILMFWYFLSSVDFVDMGFYFEIEIHVCYVLYDTLGGKYNEIN